MSNDIKIRLKETKQMDKNFLLLVIIIGYRFTIDLSYIKAIVECFPQNGFTFSWDLLRYIESYIYILIPFAFMKKNNSRLSSVFIHMQFAFMVIPMTSLYGLSLQSRFFMILICIVHVLQSILLNVRIKVPRIKLDNNLSRIQGATLIVMIIITLIIAIKKNGVPNFDALNLDITYLLRAQADDSFPLNYLAPWIAKVVCPFYIALNCHKKEYLKVIPFILIEFVLFLIFTHKTYLFASVMVVGVMLMHKKGNFSKKMYLSLGIMTLITTIIYLLNNSNKTLITMFPRRVLFIPAILKFLYYDFFSHNPRAFFADGIIGKLFSIRSPYVKSVAFTIAYEYFGEISEANTGYWGDAYANMGVLGVISASIFLVAIIKYIENNARNLDTSFVVASTFYSFYILNDGALQTNLLTGGLFLLMIMLKVENDRVVRHIRV